MKGLRRVSDAVLQGRRTWGANVRLLREVAETGQPVERRFRDGKAARRWKVALGVALRRRRDDHGEAMALVIVRNGAVVTVGPDRAGKGGAR